MSQYPSASVDSEAADALAPGDLIEVEVGPVAHGGHCVARHLGRVIFVRHALPGERVQARLTEGGPGDRFLRADAEVVLSASEQRVRPPCRHAGPGGCGGCDLQHVALPAQREWKAAVVTEQMSRLAGLDLEVTVESLEDVDGLGYRTRVELARDATAVGLRRHRSHDLVAIDRCEIATARVNEALAEVRAEPEDLADAEAIDLIDASAEVDGIIVEVPPGRATPELPIRERVAPGPGDDFAAFEVGVDARGFWQVHRDAPRAFVQAVLSAADARVGDRVLDLYSGVGLFTVPLAEAVGETGQVIAVESDPKADAHLRANLAGLPQAVALTARVDAALGVAPVSPRRGGNRSGRNGRSGRSGRSGRGASPLIPPSADVVVLDPPRRGAGKDVVGAVASLRPRRIVYVACDPSALARDTAHLLGLGWRVESLRAFDAFPMTHHVECVAVLTEGGGTSI